MIHVSEEMKTKASDLDRLTEQIREKKTLGSTTFEETIKTLTITTESWSIVKAASYFSVSEYLIRQARENRGKPLSASTAEKVQFFYEDDAHSRLMPGRKDFVTIKKNVHKQKRFLLCNLHELYVLFTEQNPVLKIGFSKFCSLRPKWCVTVGSTDPLSVCVYTIHQNANVLVNATKTGHTIKQLMEMTKLVWFTGAKNVLVQSLGEYLETFLDDGFASDRCLLQRKQ